jgi:hypothetical protein
MVTCTVTVGLAGSYLGTPGWQQIAFMIAALSGLESALGHKGHAKLLIGKAIAGVTAATLAPCLTAFLKEFFRNHALENSVIPKRMINKKKSIKAVSINVCPF